MQDQTIFTQNCRALKNQVLYPYDITTSCSEHNKINPCLQEGFYLQTPKGLLNSKINSKREAFNTIKKYSWNHSNHFFVLGLELGYHTLSILEQKPEASVWVFEHCLENIISAFLVHNFSAFILQKKLHIIYTPSTEGLDAIINNTPPVAINLFIHRASFQQHSEFYSYLNKTIDNIIQMKIINISTIEHFQRLWFNHILRNLPFYIENQDIHALKPIIYKNSCIIVGAGPSLEENIKLLKQNKNKAVIIAVNTVVSRLLAEDITPHIVVAIDPQNILYYHFIPLLQMENPPILVTEPTLCPSIIRSYKGPIFFSNLPLLYNIFPKAIIHKHTLDVGGSVTTAAYSLAVYLQAKHIIFLGLDLAYHSKRFHVRGNEPDTLYLFEKTSRFDTWEKFQYKRALPKRAFSYKGFYENKNVMIDHKFQSYIHWFENRFSYYHNTLPTFNATQGGAFLENITHIDFTNLTYLLQETKIKALQNYKHTNNNALFLVKQTLQKQLQYLEDYDQKLSASISDNYKNINPVIQELLESDWIVPKTKKFFIDIEINPTEFISLEELQNPEKSNEAIQKQVYYKLHQALEENITLLKRLLPLF